MDTQALHRLRMSFLILPAVLVACIIACNAHIARVGSRYEMSLPEELWGEGIQLADVTVEPAGMAEPVSVAPDGQGRTLIILEGRERGSGEVRINAPDGPGSFTLAVGEHDVVIADGANFTGWQAIALSALVCFLVATVLCARATATLYAHSWYGHEMIAYMAGTIFSGIETLSFLWATIQDASGEFVDFALFVCDIAHQFCRVTFVPMAIAAALVCASNVALVRNEGFRPVNLLGIATSLLWLGALGTIALVEASAFSAPDPDTFEMLSRLDSAFSISVAFGETLLASTCLCAWLASRHVPEAPRDFLIVLGCGIRPDGTCTPLLARRVEAALAYAKGQEHLGLASPTFVVSGGQGPDEVTSEAEAMRRHLLDLGVEPTHIIVEDHSATTRENMRYSAALIEAAGGTARPVAFATTNYHIFRGYVCAREAGLAAEGIAAPTRRYFWPNAFLREFVGLVAARPLQIAAALAIVVAFYLVAGFFILPG